MPYYVYKIEAGVSDLVKNLECLDNFETFKEAKNFAKSKRAEQGDDNNQSTYKVIFADNKLDAEEKLLEQREAPILKEWEK